MGCRTELRLLSVPETPDCRWQSLRLIRLSRQVLRSTNGHGDDVYLGNANGSEPSGHVDARGYAVRRLTTLHHGHADGVRRGREDGHGRVPHVHEGAHGVPSNETILQP